MDTVVILMDVYDYEKGHHHHKKTAAGDKASAALQLQEWNCSAVAQWLAEKEFFLSQLLQNSHS